MHIVGWLLFFSFPMIFINGARSQISVSTLLSDPYFWMFDCVYLVLFYLNGLVLIPVFFLKKRYAVYFAIIAALFVGFYFLKPFDRLMSGIRQQEWLSFRADQLSRHHPGDSMTYRDYRRPPHEGSFDYRLAPPGSDRDTSFRHRRMMFGPGSPSSLRPNHFDTLSLFIFIMVVALGAAMEISQQWRIAEQRAVQAEADKANAELSFLKAQINPHFLFNTLNNIYTLAITQSANTADSIMKLSNIMRYVTDDVTIDYVPLQSEVDCIADYIELQKLRIGSKTQVDFEVTGEAIGVKVAPLIMMTFVENVFKYGISKRESSTISIAIEIKGRTIRFLCRNRIFDGTSIPREGGVCIANTRQRLQFLYAGRHDLKITTDDGYYTVGLTLQTA